MQYLGYNTGNIILIEGNWYPFRITNLLQLQDDSWYYVMLDINGLKHFMPVEYYAKYGLNIGDEIKCKIDRINCTGRIFLEPQHPFYNEGENYLFEVHKVLVQAGENILIVKEKFEHFIEISISESVTNEIFNKKNVNCRVICITKGILNLELCSIIS